MALLALAVLAWAPAAAGQAPGCAQDAVVLDANGDGRASVGDVALAPPDAVGDLDGGHPLMDRPLVAVPGALAFIDMDGSGSPSAGDAALWDWQSDGASPGDVMLGNLTLGSRSYRFGHVLRAGDPLPLPTPGYAAGFAFVDAGGDGARQVGDSVYAAAGTRVAAGDARLSVSGWERGSLVRVSDPDWGQPFATGGVPMALGAVDEDGQGYSVPECPAESSTTSSRSSASATGSDSTSTSASPSTTSDGGTGTIIDPGLTPGGPVGGEQERTPSPGAGVLLALLAVAALALRRWRP